MRGAGLQTSRPCGLRGHPDQWYPPVHGDPGADPAAWGKGDRIWRGGGDRDQNLCVYESYHSGGSIGEMARKLPGRGGSAAHARDPQAGWSGQGKNGQGRSGGHWQGASGPHGEYGHSFYPQYKRCGGPSYGDPEGKRAEPVLSALSGEI